MNDGSEENGMTWFSVYRSNEKDTPDIRELPVELRKSQGRSKTASKDFPVWPDKENKVGWQTIMVYDVKGNYIFSHGYDNAVYYQTGD